MDLVGFALDHVPFHFRFANFVMAVVFLQRDRPPSYRIWLALYDAYICSSVYVCSVIILQPNLLHVEF